MTRRHDIAKKMRKGLSLSLLERQQNAKVFVIVIVLYIHWGSIYSLRKRSSDRYCCRSGISGYWYFVKVTGRERELGVVVKTSDSCGAIPGSIPGGSKGDDV